MVMGFARAQPILPARAEHLRHSTVSGARTGVFVGPPIWWKRLIIRLKVENHGTEIFKGCFEERRRRDAQAQEGQTQERAQRKEGEEPQAGDRDRPVGSAPQGEEGPEKVQQAEVEAEVEAEIEAQL